MFFFFDEFDNTVSPHTVKKFELISEYTKSWIQKLMNYSRCDGVVYIDCMSNSGVYHDGDGNEIEGTPIRVARIIADAMASYHTKRAFVYFNDNDKAKTDILKSRLPQSTRNVTIKTFTMDGNEFLKKISSNFGRYQNMNFLLVYDPFQATIDWRAIMPFLQNWGEVIINHMVSDTIRAAKVAKRPTTIEKYENTYLTDIEELVSFGSNRTAFENRIEEIIRALSQRSSLRYYIASYPFFNQTNTVVYNLIHCTGNIEGFKLYKKTAWKTFGDHSSMKNTHGNEMQMVLDLSGQSDTGYTYNVDEYCYNVNDIVNYVQNRFAGRKDVALEEVWALLDEHPVFPSEGYKPQIKSGLKKNYNAQIAKGKITFTERRG